MNKKNVNLVSLIRKLTTEYEKKHDKLYFAFEKINDHFIYTDINEKFLQELKLQKSDIIGKSLYDLKHLIEDYYEDMNRIYKKAWNGEPVFYYVTSISNPETFFVISLYPVADNNGNVSKVEGHCVPLNKNEISELRIGLSYFSENESINVIR
jgi:PAS domain-containing protein